MNKNNDEYLPEYIGCEDGCNFEFYNPSLGDFKIILNDPTKEEIHNIDDDMPVDIYLTQKGMLIFIICKMGNLGYEEAIYNPHQSNIQPIIPSSYKKLKILMQIQLINSANGKILVKRYVELTNKFSTDFFNIIKKVLRSSYSENKYFFDRTRYTNIFTTDELVRTAKFHCQVS